MKIYIYTLLLITLISCGNKAANDSTANSLKTEGLNEAPIDSAPVELKNEIKKIDWTSFESVFRYEDKEDEFVQILGINNIDSDTIEYQIYINSMLCESELSGQAIVNHPDGDFEIDEDDNGAYPVNEYLFENDSYIISIRIDAEKQSKARFILSSERENDDCDPFDHLIMKNTR